MSFYYIKSLSYKNNKVYASLAVNNLSPLYYEKGEIGEFTYLYNLFGKGEFEKKLLQDYILTGELHIKNYGNKTLKKLDYISKMIKNDSVFRKLEKEYWDSYDRFLVDNNRNKYKKDCNCNYNKKKKIIAFYYDLYNKDISNERKL